MCRFLIMLAVAIMLPGCAPIVVEKQPAIEFQVVDESNQKIEGAEIYFVRYSVSNFTGEVKSWPTIIKTNSDGRASIDKESEWQVVFLAPDAGIRRYDWAWCIVKDKYAPVSQVNIREFTHSENVYVVLKKNNEGGECIWRNEYGGGQFVDN